MPEDVAAEAVIRQLTNLGFDLGATNVRQASNMGEPVYRRTGDEDL